MKGKDRLSPRTIEESLQDPMKNNSILVVGSLHNRSIATNLFFFIVPIEDKAGFELIQGPNNRSYIKIYTSQK